tara:strand:+ start:139 stop:513 length:375 start_codon:yes stop_codon:yes gene_type:complete
MENKLKESLKNLLNNMVLLKWVKKYSADNLLDDNSLATKFGVKVNEDSISVGDDTLTKLLVTQARFSGKEFTRYNIKQLKDALEIVGAEGELIISADNNNEMFIQVKDTIVVVSPLPKTDTETN